MCQSRASEKCTRRISRATSWEIRDLQRYLSWLEGVNLLIDGLRKRVSVKAYPETHATITIAAVALNGIPIGVRAFARSA